MTKIKYLLPFFAILITSINLSSQQFYHAVDLKSVELEDTKYLKSGTLILLEKVGECDQTRVQLLHPNGEIETLLWTSPFSFYDFNELPDNNWSLTIIVENLIDVAFPPDLYHITFIDDEINTVQVSEPEINIPLASISLSTVINGNELVLSGNGKVYQTNFELDDLVIKTLPNNLELLKCPDSETGYMYYKYEDTDGIWATENLFESEELIVFNLGDQFRDIHYLGDYVIFQDENEISAAFGIFGFEWIEQGTKIYNFRQHGQNLTYHTINGNKLKFNKLYLDENGELQKDQFDFTISDQLIIPGFHWDGNFFGISYHYVPLPTNNYEDDFPGENYFIDYNLNSTYIETPVIDLNITDVQYTISNIDTTLLYDDKELYLSDISMEIELRNNSYESIEDVKLYSSAFEGFNCAHNFLRVLDSEISLQGEETITVLAEYRGLETSNINFLDHPLCVYALGSRDWMDPVFGNNIFCFTPSELTSTKNVAEETKGLKVYPNPAHDFIRISEGDVLQNYEIYDLNGQLVRRLQLIDSADVIDVSGLKKGAYLLVNPGNMRRKIFSIF